jgi:hypothetical protein
MLEGRPPRITRVPKFVFNFAVITEDAAIKRQRQLASLFLAAARSSPAEAVTIASDILAFMRAQDGTACKLSTEWGTRFRW